MNIDQLSKQIHQLNVDLGFYDNTNGRSTHEIIALIVSEVYEMLAAHRNNKFVRPEHVRSLVGDAPFNGYEVGVFKGSIKDHFEDECADIIIRMLDFAGYCKLDIDNSRFDITAWQPLKSETTFFEDILMLQDVITKSFIHIHPATVESSAFLYTPLAAVVGFAKKYNIDFETHINLKIKYIKTLQFKHKPY